MFVCYGHCNTSAYMFDSSCYVVMEKCLDTSVYFTSCGFKYCKFSSQEDREKKRVCCFIYVTGL